MSLEFCEDYWDDTRRKHEFIRFIDFIHNLDLSLWDQAGYFGDRFRPFSYFDGDKLVSSVCISSMDMMIDGKRIEVAQVSGVGTLPEYRRKGLSKKLNLKAIEWAQSTHEFFFLFADDEAFPLYKNCGFRTVDEHKFRISVTGKQRLPGAAKLDVNNKEHLKLIYDIASSREPVSDILGAYNENLFMFWCLYYLKDYIYHIPALECLVLSKRDNRLVTIYDIVGKNIPSFSELYPFISDVDDTTVEFLFMIDKMNLDSYEAIKILDNGTHLLGDFPLDNAPFIFPFTAHA
jgi:GNAT superfamily N-acetyltransferase